MEKRNYVTSFRTPSEESSDFQDPLDDAVKSASSVFGKNDFEKKSSAADEASDLEFYRTVNRSI